MWAQNSIVFFLWLIHHVSYFKLIDLDGLGFEILPPDQISEELLRDILSRATGLKWCNAENACCYEGNLENIVKKNRYDLKLLGFNFC